MFAWAVNFLEEYQVLHSSSTLIAKRPRVPHWWCPLSGRLKINVDGAFRLEVQMGGIGVVVQDTDGQCLAALGRPFSHVRSALHMEATAKACRVGMLIVIQDGRTELEVESDYVRASDSCFSKFYCKLL